MTAPTTKASKTEPSGTPSARAARRRAFGDGPRRVSCLAAAAIWPLHFSSTYLESLRHRVGCRQRTGFDLRRDVGQCRHHIGWQRQVVGLITHAVVGELEGQDATSETPIL